MPKTVHPALGLSSFNCPHCHALAHQDWFDLYIDQTSVPPRVIGRAELDSFVKEHKGNPEMDNAIQWAGKQVTGKLFMHRQSPRHGEWNLGLGFASKCLSCKDFSIWVGEKIVHPNITLDVEPNSDMPAEAATDFLEAAAIFDVSPKGAAALLRLALQKILIHLGESGKNIDGDIGSLVRKGLPVQVQQALDVVRVTGNHLVHPGQIDSADTREAALRLFSLLNIITEAMITRPREIKDLFGDLPSGALEAIERRDKPKELAGPEGKKA